jgi:hypothetical protein
MSGPTGGVGEEWPDPFAYPPKAHHRRHGPAGCTIYQASELAPRRLPFRRTIHALPASEYNPRPSNVSGD